MKVQLLQPRNLEEGLYAEDVAIFAARRCRTTKTFEELQIEIVGYSSEKRRQFLSKVIYQDFAADVMEMVHLVYDWEGIPMWLLVELFRHRLIMREFSFEQLSQRAIDSGKLEVDVDEGLELTVADYLVKLNQRAKYLKLSPEQLRAAYPQGVLVNLVIGGNLRAFHHFFFMRSSPLYNGKGGAHPRFMELADKMQELAKERLPNLMEQIVEA